jgi:L-fuconolactonase
MKIDAHQHFWKYNPVEYSWIDENMSVIRRDFLPENLKDTITGIGIDGTIAVQARQSLHETEWLLKLAEENSFIKGVVGWLPLMENNVGKDLEQFSSFSKLKALRHVVQEEKDGFLLSSDFNRGVKLLKKYRMAYDILIFAKQIPEAIKFVDMHPEQIFVLDHVAKPAIKAGIVEPWRKDIKRLAERRNVYCKISGMGTDVLR